MHLTFHYHAVLPMILAIGSVMTGCVTSPSSGKTESIQVPDTISQEARAFLIRTKGDIIHNYILEDGGDYALPAIYRKAAPDMKLDETDFNGVKALEVDPKCWTEKRES